MTDTPNLSMPLIAPAQAQKHVTHNEALRQLDSLVQLAVSAIDQPAPPAAPVDGMRYVVPVGATGAWAGQDRKLAVFEDVAWAFYQPRPGWIAWVEDRGQQWVFDGSDWVQVEDHQNMPWLGINTSADAANRLSVSSPAVLFNNEAGDIRVKLNKAVATDTASFLFQTGWSGHAEIGLTGDDDFHFKVSADGSAWFDAMVIDAASGHVSLAGVSGHIPVFDTGNSVFLGNGAGASDDLSDNRNVFVGQDAGQSSVSGSFNAALGYAAFQSNTTGSYNTALGYAALLSNTTGSHNTACGRAALLSNTTGSYNAAHGRDALYFNTTGSHNTATGRAALYSNTTGSSNTAYGRDALYANTIGDSNTAVGRNALRYTITGTDNTDYSNCSGLGYYVRVSGSNQVQLGNSSTTTYAYGAVQDRSDARDKADIRDTILGLDFIRQLRPVDFRWDMRDDYVDRIIEEDPETGDITERLVPVPKDGSRKRKRFHHGLIAQEVKEVLDRLGVDFGGFQDHSRSGGDDVLSIGYTEMIAPLIRAVQELSDRVEMLEGKAAGV